MGEQANDAGDDGLSAREESPSLGEVDEFDFSHVFDWSRADDLRLSLTALPAATRGRAG